VEIPCIVCASFNGHSSFSGQGSPRVWCEGLFVSCDGVSWCLVSTSGVEHLDWMSSSSRRDASASTCSMEGKAPEGLTRSISFCNGVVGARSSMSSKVKTPESWFFGSRSSLIAPVGEGSAGSCASATSFEVAFVSSSFASAFELFQNEKDGIL
jgi:hypothetical protein